MVKNETYRIYSEKDHDYVTMEWHGYANSSQFRQGTEEMLDKMKRRGTGKVLADIRDMVLIGQEDQNWVLGEFLPRAIKSGFKAIAIVKPVHYFNHVAVVSISNKVQAGQLEIRIFDDADAGREWLHSLNDK
jgi:hypothetical protein